MRPKQHLTILFVLSALLLISWSEHEDVWGFFGHRLINRTAVFTLPVDLIPLYKGNIDYVTEHSIDPDKRRHASPLEAIRHYIDIDHWGEDPFQAVPKDFGNAVIRFGSFQLLDGEDIIETVSGDSIWLFYPDSLKRILKSLILQEKFTLMEDGTIPLPDTWKNKDAATHLQLQFKDEFTSFGILPYHLNSDFNRLVQYYRVSDWAKVLRLSAEIGHYISDAHVPLHTTENYNGQMTGQDGIHAFWESRIPELFANDEYDLFTGRAKYIEDTDAFFWQIVHESHVHVKDVLGIELELRQTFDADNQYCNEARGASVVRQPCEAYARAYQDRMQGMVEERMRSAIAAVGSIWYTAWVDGGRPSIAEFEKDLDLAPENITEKGSHELDKSQ